MRLAVPTTTAGAAWAILLAAYAVGVQQSCTSGVSESASLAALVLLVVGAGVAYVAFVQLVWPIRRSGDVPILVGAAVLGVFGSPYLGLGAVAPVLIGVGYAFARLNGIDGPVRAKALWVCAAAALWFPVAVLVLLKLAFRCGFGF